MDMFFHSAVGWNSGRSFGLKSNCVLAGLHLFLKVLGGILPLPSLDAGGSAHSLARHPLFHFKAGNVVFF